MINFESSLMPCVLPVSFCIRVPVGLAFGHLLFVTDFVFMYLPLPFILGECRRRLFLVVFAVVGAVVVVDGAAVGQTFVSHRCFGLNLVRQPETRFMPAFCPIWIWICVGTVRIPAWICVGTVLVLD